MARPLHAAPRPLTTSPTNQYDFLRIAQIDRIDYEMNVVDLYWLDGVNEQKVQIPISQAFRTQRASINAMPEEGSIVICGFIKNVPGFKGVVILSYLEPTPLFNTQISNDYTLARVTAPDDKETLKTIQEKIGWYSVRTKRRKIYPGEINIESTQGAELYVDDNIYLSNNKLNEIEIVSADQSIRMVSQQQYIDTQACRIWNGMIVRDPIDKANTPPTIYSNGQSVQIITDTNKAYHLGGKAYTEYRKELYEKATGRLHVTEINSGKDITELAPFITFVMGTLVGNDSSTTGQSKYGKVLRPQIFGTRDATVPMLDEIACLPEEQDTLAAALKLQFKSNASIFIDKQGHLFTHFPASSGQHPLGGGRSWEGNFDGSIKWVVGKDSYSNYSIDLSTTGCIKESLGFSAINFRSKETIAQKGIYTEINGKDIDNNSYVVRATDNILMHTDSNMDIDVTGNYTITCRGKIQENIYGTKVENYINNKNNVIGGSQSIVTIGDQQYSGGGKRSNTLAGISSPIPSTPMTAVDDLLILLGSRVETLTAGDLKRTLTLGDLKALLTAGKIDNKVIVGQISDTIVTGSKSTSIITGNVSQSITTGMSSESIVTGNKTTSITTGLYSVDVKAGNISVKTKAGKVDINSLTGIVTVSGTLKAVLKSGAKAEVSAPQVSLGMSPVQGGIVTPLTWLDPITGMPPLGSVTVKASS